MIRMYSDTEDRFSGFTLIEIMIVVVIIGIMVAALMPRIMNRPDQARVIRARQDIRILENALKLYKLDNFTYPTTEQGLNALVEKPEQEPRPKNWKSDGYVDRLQLDPWKGEYQYLNPGSHGEIDIYSLGKDGMLGGDGLDAEIGNWNIE